MGFISLERLSYGPWQAIERLAYRLFVHLGFSDVQLIGGTGDHGADVLASRDHEIWVVQCKFRSRGNADEASVDEVVKALHVYKGQVGVVISNSNYTEAARRRQSELRAHGLVVYLWDMEYLLKVYEELPESAANMFALRDYQNEAVNMIEYARGSGRPHALVTIATGLGKSAIAAKVIQNQLDRAPDVGVLVLAHSVDLVRQLESSISVQLTKHIDTQLWTDGEVPVISSGVTFATWQTLINVKPNHLHERYGLVIIDEAHRGPSRSYNKLLTTISPDFLLGLTATPWRSDQNSVYEMFGKPVYVMSMIQGMAQGYLSNIDYRLLSDDIDWDNVMKQSKSGLTIADLNKLLILPDRDLSMVDEINRQYQRINDPKMLVFCRSISHANRLQDLLLSYGISAVPFHSQIEKEVRYDRLRRFRSGELKCLISIEMLNEGIDVPDVNILVFARVTHSRRIFVQQLGRGLRLSEEKKSVLVLDFVADIRRIAACLQMKDEAKSLCDKQKEVIKYDVDKAITFNSHKPKQFFEHYLKDITSIQDFDESSRLEFPSQYDIEDF